MISFTKEQLIAKYKELLSIEVAAYELAEAELSHSEVNNNFYNMYLDRVYIYTPNLDGKTHTEVCNIINELEKTYKKRKLAKFKLETYSLESTWDDECGIRYYSFYNVLANRDQTIRNTEIEELNFVLYVMGESEHAFYTNTYNKVQKIKEFKAGEIDFNTLYNFIKGKENG